MDHLVKEDKMTAQQFIETWNIHARSEQVDANLNNPEWKDANHYRVVLSYRTSGSVKQFTTYFSKGYAHKTAPTAAETIEALSMDQHGVEDGTDFGGWAMEYGYEEDSRKAEKLYRTIVKQGQDIENWLPANAWKQFLAIEEAE